MELGRGSIVRRVSVLFFCFLIAVAGAVSYFELGKLEDPTFTIKTAIVAAVYPGASADEVRREVADPLEEAIQAMGQLKEIKTRCTPGMAIIYAEMKAKYKTSALPEIWDILRQKVNDAKIKLPPGVTVVVNNDFGDVYGQYYALTGEGYSLKELKDFADVIKRELVLVPGVASVKIIGDRPDVVRIEFTPERLAAMHLPPLALYSVLNQQNAVTDAGQVKLSDRLIRLDPTSGISSLSDLENLVVGGSGGSLVRLSDLGQVTRGPAEPPQLLMEYDNRPALGIGISTVEGGNVVAMGEAVKARLEKLKPFMPIGMELQPVYLQSDGVTQSVNEFVMNVIESVAIVVGILLIFMGLRTGLLIGLVLLLVIAATLATMKVLGIFLQIVSLGTLIVALGMLVDNAIVISEEMLVGVGRGEELTAVAEKAVTVNFWPLLGGTLIAILGFMPVGLSNEAAGEFCRSLFQVISISLLWSWVLALTATPALGSFLLHGTKVVDDPYDSFLFRWYRRFLEWCIRWRFLVSLMTIGCFAVSVAGFKSVKKSFFPNSNSPYFIIDLWSPQGTDINSHLEKARAIALGLSARKDVKHVTVVAGGGGLRFLLTIAPPDPNSSYAQMIVETDGEDGPLAALQDAERMMSQMPGVEGVCKLFSKGSGLTAKVEARFSGPDPNVLRELADKAAVIFRSTPGSRFTRTDWRDRVKVLKPQISVDRMRHLGLTRPMIAQTIHMVSGGTTVGLYRDGKDLLPILATVPKKIRFDYGALRSLPIWAPAALGTVPLSSVVTSFESDWEDQILWTYNRQLAILVQSEVALNQNANDFLDAVRPKVEAIPLPVGYKLEWAGEYKTSGEAVRGIIQLLPYGVIGMFFLMVLLFNGFIEPTIIFLCLPLTVIGVTWGLLLSNQPFSFLAFLGFLSLMGMLSKNSIVLLDQVASEFATGKDRYEVIVNAGVSRLRPVSMSAVTTVLGMIPLAGDKLFAPLAVTIMAGLTVATVLTLIIVPVLCSIFYRVPPRRCHE